MKKGHQILAALFVPEAIARLWRYFNEDQFFLRRLAATRPATRPLRPRPSISMLDGSGTGVPPLEPVLPPLELEELLELLLELELLLLELLPEDPQPELPQPELPQPELPQPELPQVAFAGAPAANAMAAMPVRTAHLIGFKIYLHPSSN